MRGPERIYEFKFFDGQQFRGWGLNERDALVRLGLGAYNPVAYKAQEVEGTATILSIVPDGHGYHYGWYKDDHRQINVRFEGQDWIAYVGGEKVGVLASKNAAEAAAIRFIVENPVGESE